MKLPKVVRIGAHKFPLMVVEQVAGSDDYWGMYYPHGNGQKIELSNALEGSHLAECTLHELAHAIVDEAGYEFPSDEDEEKFVESFSKVLTQFFKDNKTCVRAILTALK